MFGLSKRQKEILDAIASLQDENGFCPSYAEIAVRAGTKSKSEVYRIIRQLEVRGYVRFLPGQARSIQVIRANQGTTESP